MNIKSRDGRDFPWKEFIKQCHRKKTKIEIFYIKREMVATKSNTYNLSHVMKKPVYAVCVKKAADQPAHPRSLISAFVVRCLNSMIPLISVSEIASLYLASVAAQASLCLTWSQIPKTDFLVTRLI